MNILYSKNPISTIWVVSYKAGINHMLLFSLGAYLGEESLSHRLFYGVIGKENEHQVFRKINWRSDLLSWNLDHYLLL